ncbi:Flap endonuclease-1 protein [Rhizoctonia solani]|uniref:Flap endonuclease-1 protein n=1 Tax=Rhizoctonia solani TaxID=456999 RepID=A0A8H8SV14_9AGAM|nr:Flap endonuclease-1 protein [Rhizoctonia solani]QRW17668.1 Flap endonuclease-1 protein [Rhizoctonia solani]
MGVKQLWTLLSPAGRPVPLETLEGKVLAIDSSIWLYQFQATMRDKEGRALVNAHILGFLRRTSKLLFHGIKPVFVFDGGAPVLKRSTIAERKKRKSGAAANHAKVAERLLAAQLRREALRHTEERERKDAENAPDNKHRSLVDDDTNYLEDLSGPTLVLPGKLNAPAAKPASKSFSPSKTKQSSKPAGKTFREHDPYQLPELDASIDSRTLPNDPRLATDEELRAYISRLRPDDPEFHELPADAQYEILGELRLKSRTTSHKRLQKMLRQSKTPMDFSMAQIKNLGQRNRLTQEVLSTLNLVGTGAGGVVVPVKIASEKNREYVLVRNEGGDRGFTLGIRQEGNTAEKPIVVEEEEGDDSFDSKIGDIWEDVIVPGRQIGVAPDQDWRDFKRQNALDGLSKRDTRKHLAPLTTKTKLTGAPRLDKGKGKEVDLSPESEGSHSSAEEDMDFQLAVQASLAGGQFQEDEEDDLSRALALSLSEHNKDSSGATSISANHEGSGAEVVSSVTTSIVPDSELFGAPTGLLGLSTSVAPQALEHEEDDEEDLDMEEVVIMAPVVNEQGQVNSTWEGTESLGAMDACLSTSEPIPSQSSIQEPHRKVPSDPKFESPQLEPTSQRAYETRRELEQALVSSGDEDDLDEVPLPSRLMTLLAPYQTPSGSGTTGSPTKRLEEGAKSGFGSKLSNTEDENPTKKPQVAESGGVKRVTWDDSPKNYLRSAATQHTLERNMDDSSDTLTTQKALDIVPDLPKRTRVKLFFRMSRRNSRIYLPNHKSGLKPSLMVPAYRLGSALALESNSGGLPQKNESNVGNESWENIPTQISDDEEEIIPWSRSPTPTGARSPVAVPVHSGTDFDSAHSRNTRFQDEEEEHAAFMSQLQGKSYATMRESLDAEIAALRKERAAALRDAEDVTTQMSAQIQYFYHGLVEGVITDDSDVFLFGAGRVYRNMFNQSKTVECFLAADLDRELGLDRETLISLAYLLGSDYTEGLPGVGPVVAMEIMKEFPGENGLREFCKWWRKVQVGKDVEADLGTTFRKRFKKKFTTLHLNEEWPNPKVREAYLEPTVDESEERFQWGLPDLDVILAYEKVDETIIPIIRRMTQRSSSTTANRQGTLTSFIEGHAFTSNNVTRAPRKTQAYASKRLQQVVAEYRSRKSGERSPDENGHTDADAGFGKDKREVQGEGEVKPRASRKKKPQGVGNADANREPEGSSASLKVAKRKRLGTGAPVVAKEEEAQPEVVGEVEAGDDEEELDSNFGSDNSDGNVEPEAASPKKLRLRPRMKKPSPVPRSPAQSDSEGGSNDEYMES